MAGSSADTTAWGRGKDADWGRRGFCSLAWEGSRSRTGSRSQAGEGMMAEGRMMGSGRLVGDTMARSTSLQPD